ncbi:reverse transcriptase domain-containing protein [Tanacetum coccineum]
MRGWMMHRLRRQMVTSRVNILVRDRHAHARTARLMEFMARMSQEAWGRFMDVSDLTCTKVMALRTQAMIDQGVTASLAARDADRNTNGDDSHISGAGVRRTERTAHEFENQVKGTEEVVKLTQWVEKMETVFRIRNYSVENQVKFSTCTLLGNALTWWNSHVKTIGNDVDYAMTWTELKKKMTGKYCLRTEIKKLEVELWDLKVKESDKIERYVGGLPDMIHRSIVASKPKTMQEATKIAIELIDKRICTFSDRQTENKRKQDNNQQQQPQNKRQNTGRAYAVGTSEKKLYGGSKPLCPKSPANANTTNNQRCIGTGQKPTCYECGAKGHFKRECPKLKNNNNRGDILRGKCQCSNESVCGRPCRDKPRLQRRNGSFVSTAFSLQIDITPTTLDHYYDVELADGRIIGLNTILRGCTLNIMNHPFNIDLMPIELGSFDAIIGMDCNRGNEARLYIISHTKTQEYMLKGCPVFLANVTTKETEDNSGKKRLEDISIVQDFPDVFHEDLTGLPLTQQVEF